MPESPTLAAAPGAPAVLLASGSSARAAMLRAAGVPFERTAVAVDEGEVRSALKAEGATAEDTAVVLASLKAQRAATGQGDDVIVIGADQILELDDAWLEKPADRAAARAQLLALRGRAHRLVSAAVAWRGGARVWHQTASARLWVRPFGEAFLDAYLDAAGEAVQGSVGAYQLEGLGAQLMSRVEGDHFTVLGLPLLPLLAFLREQGVLPR